MSTAKTETVPASVFAEATPNVEAKFAVDASTIEDVGRIPLEMAFEAQIKAASAAVKEKRAEVAAAESDLQKARASVDDPAVKARRKDFQASADLLRKRLVAAVSGSGIKIGKPIVALSPPRFDDAKGLRAFSLQATFPQTKPPSPEPDDEEEGAPEKVAPPAPAGSVSGVSASLSLEFSEPITEEQSSRREALRDREAELASLEESWRELVREKEETLKRHSRYAKFRFAQIATAQVPGVSTVVDGTYDKSYAANVLSGLKHFDASALAASEMLPATALPAPAKSPKK